jgi:hypothetical protein
MADYVWPAAPVNSVYLLTFHMSWCGQKLMNTYHYTMIANPIGLTVEAAYDFIDVSTGGAADKLRETHTALRDSACNLTQCTVQMVWPTRYVAKAYIKNVAGAIPAANDVPNLHATISRRAVGGTRKDSGHVHIPVPIDVTVLTDGVFTAAYKVKLNAHAVAMDADLGGPPNAHFQPCLFNRNNVPTTRVIGVTAVKDEVRCSRRRTVGLGI